MEGHWGHPGETKEVWTWEIAVVMMRTDGIRDEFFLYHFIVKMFKYTQRSVPTELPSGF